MKEMIYRCGRRRERFVYRRMRLERNGFLKVLTFEVDECAHRMDLLAKHPVIGVLPVDFKKREAWLVEQPRHTRAFTESEDGIGLMESAMRDGWTTEEMVELETAAVDTLELPAGYIDPGEDAPTAAIRELREETGLIVGKDALEKAVSFYPSVGICTEYSTLFFAHLPDPLRRAETLSDEDKDRVTVWRIGFDDLYAILAEDGFVGGNTNMIMRELFIRDRLKEKLVRDHVEKLG